MNIFTLTDYLPVKKQTIHAGCFILGAVFQNGLLAYSGTPPQNQTGAPGGSATCAACHSGTGTGSLNLDFLSSSLTYEPGETYAIDVVIEDTGQFAFGYSMVAREGDGNTTPSGTWIPGSNSTAYSSGTHIGHSLADYVADMSTFEVSWTAPETDVGPITFYAVANAADGDGSAGTGDHIYLTTLTINPATASSGSFWADSPASPSGWRLSGEGYPGETGMGWMNDIYWPWIYTTGLSNPAGEWVYVQETGNTRGSFYAYVQDDAAWIYGDAVLGWYYSYGEEDFFYFDLGTE
jgi:hypothetical protein